MMTEKRYYIESAVTDVFNTFADENDLERDFYGETYPDEVMQLENDMERMSDDEIEASLEQLKEDLKAWYL